MARLIWPEFRWRMHREPSAKTACCSSRSPWRLPWRRWRGRCWSASGRSSSSATSRRRRSSSASFSASSSIARPRWPRPWIAWPRRERVRAMAFELAQSGDGSPYLTEARAWRRRRSSISLRLSVPTETSSVPRSGRRALAIRSLPQRRPPRPPFSSAKSCPTAARPWASLRCAPCAATSRLERRGAGVRLVGGERLDQSFLADLPVAPGMQVSLYSDAGPNCERQPRRNASRQHRHCRLRSQAPGRAQLATFPARRAINP